MHRVGEIHRLICAQPAQHARVPVNERGLLFGRGKPRKAFGFAIFEPQSREKLDAARMRIL